MRLLRTSDMKLVEFPYNPPPYAILSHTWGSPADEVLFDDIVSGIETAKSKVAYDKLMNTCTLAQSHGLEYCWIDTCCIDKRSSAELQEAINSMFDWYKNSDICYAYLSDVTVSDLKNEDFEKQFRQAHWFTRGWTLQELIAPNKVIFYTKYWEEIGEKKCSLIEYLSSITRISREILFGTSELASASIAQRMSWASGRETSRKEDIAYCLLGLFSVNMPMLYGEGDNAFLRLQLEIISNLDDESIFAWLNSDSNIWDGAGLLAKHPRNFSHCGDIVLDGFDWAYSQDIAGRVLEDPPAMTGRGIRIRKNLIPISSEPYFVMPLRCAFAEGSSMIYSHVGPYWIGSLAQYVLGILITRRPYSGTYHRVNTGQFFSVPILPALYGTAYTLFVPQQETFIYANPWARQAPRNPKASPYSVHKEHAQLWPMCLTDADNMSWAIISWIVRLQVSPEEASGHFERVVLEYEGKDIGTIWLGLHNGQFKGRALFSQLAGQLDPDSFWSPIFKVTGYAGETGTQEEQLVESQAWRIGKHVIRVLSDPVEKSIMRKIPDLCPIFVVQTWNEESNHA